MLRHLHCLRSALWLLLGAAALVAPALGQDFRYSPLPNLHSSTDFQQPPIVDPPPPPSSDLPSYNSAYGPSTSVPPLVILPASTELGEVDVSEVTEAERIAKLEQRMNALDAAKSKLPSVTVNGVFQADAVWFNQTDESRDQYGSIESGANFRRARLSARGSVTEQMNYFMQMDFAFFGRPTFTDLWVEQTQVPGLGTVRVGQWKQPFSLEVVSSFRYTTFMERSPLFQAFTPFRHLGLGFYNHSSDLNSTWAASYFRTGQDQFGGSLSTNGGNGLAGRVTHLLWYGGDSGNQYLHIGGGYFLNSPPRNSARFRSIPEMFVGEFAPTAGPTGTSGTALPGTFNGTPFFVDTGTLTDVSDVQTFGLETLWVRGPFSFQSEGMAALVDQPTSTALLSGTYAQVGYFLTGEHRPYDRKSGAIERVMPSSSVGKGGIGAWEIAGRFSLIDLTDDTVQGGDLRNMTAGVNWYLNPYCKWVFNYIHSWSDGRDFSPTPSNRTLSSQTDSFATRVQLDF